MKSRASAKHGAADIVRLLTDSAVQLSHSDLPLAKEQASLARKLRLKFNVRPDDSIKRFTCRGCKGLLVPGVNARVRLGHGRPKILRITCSDCGRVNRKILSIA